MPICTLIQHTLECKLGADCVPEEHKHNLAHLKKGAYADCPYPCTYEVFGMGEGCPDCRWKLERWIAELEANTPERQRQLQLRLVA